MDALDKTLLCVASLFALTAHAVAIDTPVEGVAEFRKEYSGRLIAPDIHNTGAWSQLNDLPQAQNDSLPLGLALQPTANEILARDTKTGNAGMDSVNIHARLPDPARPFQVSSLSDTSVNRYSRETLIGDNSLGLDQSSTDGWAMSDVPIGTLPEPGTLFLMVLGLLGLGLARRRTAKKV